MASVPPLHRRIRLRREDGGFRIVEQRHRQPEFLAACAGPVNPARAVVTGEITDVLFASNLGVGIASRARPDWTPTDYGRILFTRGCNVSGYNYDDLLIGMDAGDIHLACQAAALYNAWHSHNRYEPEELVRLTMENHTPEDARAVAELLEEIYAAPG
jgi:hypothetical protein